MEPPTGRSAGLRMISAPLLAAVGEVGKGFVHKRTSGTLPCQARHEVFCFDWARNHIDRYAMPTLQHLELVVLSVLLGFAVAFALALVAHRTSWLRPPLLAATGVLYTIPSLAFFFLLLPVTGLGRDTAIIVLAAYTLQIIYRNTILGLANVPAPVKDAARGMGLTDRQILWRVELPLAMPEIIAGLRIATVSTVAIATLAVFIGAGGLGTQIYGSGNLSFPTSIIIAATIAILMALALDALLVTGQRLTTPWRKARTA
jgi:osmoprotectant transport system permease protein